MLSVAIPVLFAVFVWWFSTGLILLLDGLPRNTFRWSLVISSALAITAFAALMHTAGKTTPADAYCAFTCALLVWGWHELAFLTGWITGPRKTATPAGASGWTRFVHAIQAILWHEIAIISVGIAIVAVTWGEPNQVGTWTYLVLWSMRTSAKLNLFLGVRNLSEEFLPEHLKYLVSFFRRRAMNLLFPISVTVPTIVAALMVQEALAPATSPALHAGLLLVATMLGMAVIEHWMMVLPLPVAALWRWALRSREPGEPHDPPALLVPPSDNNLLHAR
ncbi:photosynthetic complex assembly protein 2 [Rubrivivax gelatinosus]|nr:photosynthetic complex assembly protein 2 [Rubrivivax gelatinosus]